MRDLTAVRVQFVVAPTTAVDGSLHPVPLDWTGLNSPPLIMIVKRSLRRQPRMRAWVDFMVDQARQMTL